LGLSVERCTCAGDFRLFDCRTVLSGEILMTTNSYLQIIFYVATLLVLAKPLGWYMARVYEGESVGLNRLLAPVERLIYRLSGVNPNEEMRWMDYAIGLLIFNLLGVLAVFAL